MLRTVLVLCLGTGLAMAADPPPRNQLPHVSPELEKLRTLTRDQQLRIADLKSQIERLNRELEGLKSAQDKMQETVSKLQAELGREKTQSEGVRTQLTGLEREVYRPKGNKKELVGAWTVTAVEENGAKKPAAFTRLVFTTSSVTFHQKEPGRERVYSYKVDPEAQPRELDVFGGEFRPTLAIYQLADDHLTLCIDHRLTGRPSEFASKPDSGTSVWTLEREAQPRKEGATLQAANVPTALANSN